LFKFYLALKYLLQQNYSYCSKHKIRVNPCRIIFFDSNIEQIIHGSHNVLSVLTWVGRILVLYPEQYINGVLNLSDNAHARIKIYREFYHCIFYIANKGRHVRMLDTFLNLLIMLSISIHT
jgi:hypothetical protein